MKQTWWAGHHSLEVGPPIPRHTLFSTLSFHCICILHCTCILKVGPSNTHYYLVFRYITFSCLERNTSPVRLSSTFAVHFCSNVTFFCLNRFFPKTLHCITVFLCLIMFTAPLGNGPTAKPTKKGLLQKQNQSTFDTLFFSSPSSVLQRYCSVFLSPRTHCP